MYIVKTNGQKVHETPDRASAYQFLSDQFHTSGKFRHVELSQQVVQKIRDLETGEIYDHVFYRPLVTVKGNPSMIRKAA